MTAAEPSLLAVEIGLPEGWAEMRVGDYFESWGGMTPSTSEKSYWDGEVPWVSSQDIKQERISRGQESITKKALAETRLRLAPVGSVLVVVRSGILAHTLPIAVTEAPLTINQDLKAFWCAESELNEWLALALRARTPEILERNRKDGTTVQSIRYTELCNLNFPTPPLAEQKRIVKTVEQLSARVNATRERLARVPAILKRFRQAVLAAACSGRLTVEWREQHADTTSDGLVTALRCWKDNPSQLSRRKKQERSTEFDEPHENLPEAPATWKWIAFGEMLLSLRSGSTEVPQNEPTEYPILRSSSVRPGSIDLQDVRFVSVTQSRRRENFLAEEDLLFTRLSGSLEYVANCALVRDLGGRQIQYPDRLFCGRLKDPRCAQYVETAFASPLLRDFLAVESKSSAGHQRISMGALTNFPIPLPPLDEQHEITRRVEALFKLADTIEKRVAVASARADRLTQSVLAKAFRGELVPTEAELARREGRSYEPASALLDRIRAERKPTQEPTRSKHLMKV